jgi:hypothetical protein
MGAKSQANHQAGEGIAGRLGITDTFRSLGASVE